MVTKAETLITLSISIEREAKNKCGIRLNKDKKAPPISSTDVVKLNAAYFYSSTDKPTDNLTPYSPSIHPSLEQITSAGEYRHFDPLRVCLQMMIALLFSSPFVTRQKLSHTTITPTASHSSSPGLNLDLDKYIESLSEIHLSMYVLEKT